MSQEKTGQCICNCNSFFLFFSLLSVIVWDMWGTRRAKKKIPWCIAALLLLAIIVFLVYILINYTVLTDLLGHAMLLTFAPLFCAVTFLCAFVFALSKVISKSSVIMLFAEAAYGTVYIVFPFMYHRPLRILYTVGMILCGVMIIYDIIKFIRYKEKKENDS